MATLNVFLDEAGNFDFSNGQGASEWLTLTSLTTTDPSEAVAELYQVKHELISQGHEIEYFHATEDKQVVRDEVFRILSALKMARVDSLAVRKRRLTPAWRMPQEFYPRMLEYLLKYTLDPRGADVAQFDRVHIFMDRVQLPRKKQDALIGGIKRTLKSYLGDIPYAVMMHSSAAHLYLQAADYCCWAMNIRREREEERPYKAISHLVKSDFDIFEHGNSNWY